MFTSDGPVIDHNNGDVGTSISQSEAETSGKQIKPGPTWQPEAGEPETTANTVENQQQTEAETSKFYYFIDIHKRKSMIDWWLVIMYLHSHFAYYYSAT